MTQLSLGARLEYLMQKQIDPKIVKDCIAHGVLAPNSSNLQLWEFYHIISSKMMKKIVSACFNQPAAKTANQFVIPVVRKDLWKERIASNVAFIESEHKKSKIKDSKKTKGAITYYQKILPKIYGAGIIKGWINNISVQIKGLKKVVYRQVKKIRYESSSPQKYSFSCSKFLNKYGRKRI